MPLVYADDAPQAPPDPTPAKMREFDVLLPMPQGRAELLLGRRGEALNAIRGAASPFDFAATADPRGLGLDGDWRATLIAEHAIRKLFPTTEAINGEPAAPVEETIAAVVADALKRDFVFRLKGIFHPVRPLSLAQIAYMDDLLDRTAPLVFGVGPTGTGKTHLAIAAAISLLAQERVKRIVVTRPHVLEDGEVMTAETRAERRRDDQFAPIFDVLHDLLRHDAIEELMDQRRLEVLPLGLIRGRTFNDSYIVIDEAQDMTVQRMRMAVTRIGRRSRMVVTGDPSQVTLRTDEPSGLAHLLGLLRGKDIARIHAFERRAIIRNETVAKLEALYADA